MIKILHILNLNLKEKKTKNPKAIPLPTPRYSRKKKKKKTSYFSCSQNHTAALQASLPPAPQPKCGQSLPALCVRDRHAASDPPPASQPTAPAPATWGAARASDRLLPSPPRPVRGAARGILPTPKSSPALPSRCPRPRGPSQSALSLLLPPSGDPGRCRGFAPAIPTARMLLPGLLQGDGPMCSSMRASLATLFLHTHNHLLPDPHVALSCSPFLHGTYCQPIRWIFNSPPWSRKFHKGHGFACCPPTPRTRCQAPRRRSRTVC